VFINISSIIRSFDKVVELFIYIIRFCNVSDISKRRTMRLVILPSSSDVGVWSAKYVMKRINDFNPGPDRYFVLGLPTGSTPLAMYKKLIELYKAGKLSFKYVKTFNMDEYVGKGCLV
jgi:hypothetical protein